MGDPMENFKSNYKGRILSFSPKETPDGWISTLCIAEHRDGKTFDTKFFPDDGTPYASQEEAAGVAEAFGKRIVDEASQQ